MWRTLSEKYDRERHAFDLLQRLRSTRSSVRSRPVCAPFFYGAQLLHFASRTAGARLTLRFWTLPRTAQDLVPAVG